MEDQDLRDKRVLESKPDILSCLCLQDIFCKSQNSIMQPNTRSLNWYSQETDLL